MLMEGRKNTRTPKQFLVQICAVHDPRLVGMATVENVSLRGTRITTWRSWELGSQLEINHPLVVSIGPEREWFTVCQSVRKNLPLGWTC